VPIEDVTSSDEVTEEISSNIYAKEILTACASTPKADNIILEEDGKEYKTRAQIHTLLIGAFGTGKTSSLLEMDTKETCIMTDVTLPYLVGTIDSKTGQYTTGGLVKAAGKIFVLDEIQNSTSNARMALLDMLEHQRYHRGLGYKIYSPVNEKRKYYSVHAENTNFEITSRFSCICSGVYVPEKYSNPEKYKMWSSRFIPVNIIKTMDDIENMLMGRTGLMINPTEYKHQVTFPRKKYAEFIKRYFQVVKNLKFKEYFTNPYDKRMGYLLRNANDMSRYACYLAGVEGLSEVNDNHYEQALALMPITLYNTIHDNLSEMDYKILLHYDTTKQEDLADVVGVNQATICRHIEILKKRGLIV